jgi:tRNA dimethylallyltransferase
MNTADPSTLKRVALIAGPTASGKSAIALDLAEREGGTIINADASQVYRDLRILTARPSAEEEARAPHSLFGYRDGALAFSAAAWAQDARDAITQAHAAGRLPILVGGTGLYLRTLIDGIAPVPAIDPDVRAAVRLLGASEGHALLQREDPSSAARLHPNDTSRVHRALEVVRSTGRPIGEWQRERTGGLSGTVAIEARLIDRPVDEVYARCDARVADMVDAGALDEVALLLARGLDPALPVMRAIGVQPFAACLDGRIGLPEAIAQVRQDTRNYAKRQRTWLRHQLTGVNFFSGATQP